MLSLSEAFVSYLFERAETRCAAAGRWLRSADIQAISGKRYI